MIVRWFGQASILMKAWGENIYIDPYAGKYTEKADMILITHDHPDHCDVEKILSISQPVTVVLTSAECSRKLSGNVEVLAPGETREVKGIKIVGVEAYNVKRFRSSGIPYHLKGTQVGFLVEAEGKTIYHAGDTDFLPSMKRLGKIDVALIPIGGTFTMDLDEAVTATLAINPKTVVPIHRLKAHVKAFKEKVESQSGIMVAALAEGEDLEL